MAHNRQLESTINFFVRNALPNSLTNRDSSVPSPITINQTDTTMALEYYLIPNHLNPDSGTYMAKCRTKGTFTLEDIFDIMTEEGSAINRAEALANFEMLARVTAGLLRQGYAVKTPLANFRPGIGGNYNSEDDAFDPVRHTKKIITSPGARLRRDAGDFPIQKIIPEDHLPEPIYYYDSDSGTKNQLITPGKGARITGAELAFDEEDNSQGVFFVNTENHSVIRIEEEMLRNKPKELIFLNPELPEGTYRLEVRSILKHNSDIRTGILYDELIVDGAA